MFRFQHLLILTGLLLTMNTHTFGASFGDDLVFLQQHNNVIVLQDESGMKQIAIVPEYQGRVMTSTAQGKDGMSFGWINRELIGSRNTNLHLNAFGGEDRFWMGPEGGQFSIFFKKGQSFNLDDWQTPPFIDTIIYRLKGKTDTEAVFEQEATFKNMSNTMFDVRIERTVKLISDEKAEQLLGTSIPDGVNSVVYESDNTVENIGKNAWTKETGLLSIWILGMYNPSPEVTIVIPYNEGPEDKLGPIVNDAYFGKIPEDRLIIKDGLIYFKGDGNQRGKIGLSPQRSKPVAGSYDAENKALTIVQLSIPEGATEYVNSMWEMQDEPFKGDVINSYNDGPPEPGAKPLGPFYELETSSPALSLAPGFSATHIHRTFHFTGNESDLDKIAGAVLGVGLEEIKGIF